MISFHWVFVVVRSALSFIKIDAGYVIQIMDLFSIMIFLVFTTILVLKGLNQLKVFSGIEERLKYANSKLSDINVQEYVQQLTNYMKTQKPHLTPSLSIEELSEKLSIPSWHLSQVINEYFNQNFFNFINSYRVEEAKHRLKDPTSNSKTILEVVYEVGFNSKSTFNDVFKRTTGMTPSEFKKLNQN